MISFLHKPKIFVELGTYDGFSFLSFYRKDMEKAYAIDTWQGDTFMSYPSEIEDNFRQRVRDYPNVTILKSTFENAFPLVPNDIDLLHIDGSHDYGSVKKDFELYFPKCRKGSLIVFHDIFVDNPDFGVRKYFEERESEFESLKLDFSCGLGIFKKG